MQKKIYETSLGGGVRNIFETCLLVRHMLVLQNAIVSHWLVRRHNSISLHCVRICSFFSEGLLDALTFLRFPTCFAKTISCCIFARHLKRPSTQPHRFIVTCGVEWLRANLCLPFSSASTSPTCQHLPATSKWLCAPMTRPS